MFSYFRSDDLLMVVEEDICDRIVEPAEMVSHRNINMGTALILSNSGKLKLMSEDANTVYLRTDIRKY